MEKTLASCCICRNSTSKELKKETPSTTFHRFPKSVGVRKIWIEACGFSEQDQVNSLFICSDHFTPSDFNSKGRKRNNAYPTINVPYEIIQCVAHPYLDIPMKEGKLNAKERVVQPSYGNDINCPEFIDVAAEVSVSSNIEEIGENILSDVSSAQQDPSDDPFTQNEDGQCISEISREVGENTFIDVSLEKQDYLNQTIPYSPVRYIGAMKEQDFTSPQRRKENLILIKKTISKLKYENRKLKQQNRRLIKKNTFLKDLLTYL